MNRRYLYLGGSLILFLCFAASTVWGAGGSYREQLDAGSAAYLLAYEDRDLFELISMRTDLNADLGKTYNRVFAADPTQRIKIANYLRILNKSVDSFNRQDVNAPLITRADRQFEEEFLPLARSIDPDFMDKLTQAMSLDYLIFKKMFVEFTVR
jgi:hypothetical protein